MTLRVVGTDEHVAIFSYSIPYVSDAQHTRTGERASFTIGSGDVDGIRLCFNRRYRQGAQERFPIGDVTVTVVVDTGTATAPVTFGGAPSKLIHAGDYNVLSDVILPSALGLAKFPQGAKYWYKAQGDFIASNGDFEVCANAYVGESGSQGFAYDPTQSHWSALATPGPFQYIDGPFQTLGSVYRPIVLGTYATGDPLTLGCVIDSIIAHGQTDPQGGYGLRAAQIVTGGPIAVLNMARDGGDLTHVTYDSAMTVAMLPYARAWIEESGANDLIYSDLATHQTNVQFMWSAMRAAGVEKIIRPPVLPRTDSSDNWTSASGQTYQQPPWQPSGVVDQFNAWIATKLADGTVDSVPSFAAGLDATTPQKWKTDGSTGQLATSDGTHPSPAASGLMAVPVSAYLNSLPYNGASAPDPSPMQIAVDNPGLLWSPCNWDDLPVGTFGVSVHSRQTACANAYLRTRLSGTASVALAIDTSTLGSLGAALPLLKWSIDGDALQSLQLTTGLSSVALASGLSTSTTHDLTVYVAGFDESGERWGSSGTSPKNVVRIVGLTVDAGGVVSLPPDVRPNTYIGMGDSIVEGVRAAGTTTEPADHGRSSPVFIAPHLSAEVGIIGYGATGWETSGSGGRPAFPITWKYHSAGRPIDFSTPPTYMSVMHGYNGTTSASTVTAWLTDARMTLGATTWIFVLIAPSGRAAQAVMAGVATYQAANPSDTRVVFIDYSGTVSSDGLNQFGTPSAKSVDGVHPYEATNQLIADAAANLMLAALPITPDPTPPVMFYRVRSMFSTEIDNGFSAGGLLGVMAAQFAAPTHGQGSAAPTFQNLKGTTNRVTAVLDSRRNRVSVTVDAS